MVVSTYCMDEFYEFVSLRLIKHQRLCATACSVCKGINMMRKFSHLSKGKHLFGQDLVVCICTTVCVLT